MAVTRHSLGSTSFPPTKNGAVIEEVVDDGPADKAGIQANDKIVAFGGVKDIKNRKETTRCEGAASGR